MAKPQLTKNWTITPNVRLTPFVSLVATMGWFVYQNVAAMIAAGWTCKFSSDGVTGPANAADATNRIASAANFATRAAAAGAPQSWIVVQNVDGVQVLFTYQGASDDIARISMSQAGAFTLAATTTHQPTAADEVLLSNGSTLINATTSGDRVMSIGCTNESWWCAPFRANAWTTGGGPIGVEKIDSACDTAVLAKPYVVIKIGNPGYDGSTSTSPSGGPSLNAVGASTWLGIATRVFTAGAFRNVRVGGGGYSIPNSGSAALATAMSGVQPSLQNGNAIVLLPLNWFGENINPNCTGYLGSPFDWWLCVGSVGNPALGDMIAGLDPGDTQDTPLRTNWLVAFGSGTIRAWRNAAAALQTA